MTRNSFWVGSESGCTACLTNVSSVVISYPQLKLVNKFSNLDSISTLVLSLFSLFAVQ